MILNLIKLNILRLYYRIREINVFKGIEFNHKTQTYGIDFNKTLIIDYASIRIYQYGLGHFGLSFFSKVKNMNTNPQLLIGKGNPKLVGKNYALLPEADKASKKCLLLHKSRDQ